MKATRKAPHGTRSYQGSYQFDAFLLASTLEGDELPRVSKGQQRLGVVLIFFT